MAHCGPLVRKTDIIQNLVYRRATMGQLWKGGAGGESAIMLRIGDLGMYGKSESRWEQRSIFGASRQNRMLTK